ncbi:lipid asymmetry maintenance protein MlaB [Thiomicrospira sp. ALE5]|uniref:STAS domain-containing protein n=1 Tax=Thiomicrospira sp. ALE5 TaxID=748650 RepID=UPI0008EC71C9|nr:STAS domain-containing protein [Thiomicrospira sp. ALE5]SFR49686.1 STAS domain-containing protein [Thiomicrospira sp. ALE5]
MSNQLSLPESLTIQNVQAEYTRLGEALLGLEGGITLQADQVQNVDTAGLQLLVAFVTRVQREGQALTWQDPSDSLIKNAENLGLTEFLQL